MGLFSSLFGVALIALLYLFSVSFALDMSIISYNDRHGEKVSGRSDEEVKGLYEAWLVEHGKAYNALGEKEKRFEIFKDNLRFIDEHNAEDHTYKLGLNRFADLSNEEYRALYLGTRTDSKRRFSRPKSDRYRYREGEELPDSVDWREKGAVAPVKDQGSCGECRLCYFSNQHIIDYQSLFWLEFRLSFSVQ